MGIVSIIGIIITLVGMVKLLIVAFRESILWGLACLLIPVVSLVFVIMHWENSKKSFLIYVVGLFIMGVGVLLEQP